MPRFKTVNEALKVVNQQDQIRNFGVIAHVDHGKTTLSDNLLLAAGMVSPNLAGQALVLDYMDLEQKRSMTIKAANVTLYYEYNDVPYVFNMIDTPGHIDFTGKVTRSLRALDGAVVVVDSVEGIMVQTETVTKQALDERVRPVLFINKIDRLVKELRLTPDKMQKWLGNIIADFNRLVDTYAEPEYKDKWKVSVQDDTVAFGSAKDRWGFNLTVAKDTGISFKDVYDVYTGGDVEELRKKAPLHDTILRMIIRHAPPPHVAQRYRIPKIWHGDLNSEVGKAMLECDPNGPVIMMVTNAVVDPQAGIVATGRLFSGTVHEGDTVWLVNTRVSQRIQSVQMFMGPYREVVGMLPAGNIPALLGLDKSRSGETLSTTKDMVPFESLKYVAEPVVTISVEPKNPRDLPKVVEALQRMHIEDPNLVVTINEETGETLVSGMGVLHLEVVLAMLAEQNLDVIASRPVINYRETVLSKAGPVMAKSPNRHNKVYVRIEPLPEEIVELIRTDKLNENMDKKEIAKILRDYGWEAEEARGVVSIDDKGNIFVDDTKGVQYLQESMDYLKAGWMDVMNAGPLAQEYVRGTKVVLHHFVPHEDPAHRTYAQLMPAMRKAVLGSMLLAQPTLLEPILGIEVSSSPDLIGTVAGVITSKRGKVIDIIQKEYLSVIVGEIPAAETSDLSEVMRGATGGKAMWTTHFKAWRPVPSSMLQSVVESIRKRKGLPPSVSPPEEFLDKD